MELRQLEYFAAVARHRHFTRAAEALYVTQPALSQQVRRLEAELGLALLRRTSRGVELTAAGQDLLVHAEAVLAEVAAARAQMDRHTGVSRGVVRVAATRTAPRTTPACSSIADRAPETSARIVSARASRSTPAGVSSTPRLVRRSSATPSSASSRRTCCESAGWVTYAASAARPKCRCRATATKYSSCRSSTGAD